VRKMIRKKDLKYVGMGAIPVMAFILGILFFGKYLMLVILLVVLVGALVVTCYVVGMLIEEIGNRI
jgi:hypothetical protein